MGFSGQGFECYDFLSLQRTNLLSAGSLSYSKVVGVLQECEPIQMWNAFGEVKLTNQVLQGSLDTLNAPCT